MARKCQRKGTMVLPLRGNSLSVLCFSLVVVLLLLSQAGCQQQASTAQGPPAPRITLEKVVHDFGDVGPESTHTAQFKFTNTGSRPLKITQVRSCCGVTTKGVRNGQEYAPGAAGALEIDYPAGPYPGTMTKNLYLYTNDPNQKIITLTIKAKIVRRVDFKPQRLSLFLRQDNGGCDDITLTSLDGQAFSIAGFRCTGNTIAAEFDPTVRATQFVLKPKADMEKLQRYRKGQIIISLTHPECNTIRMLYDVLPEFTINPPTVMLFNLKANQGIQRDIWILANYDDEFEIESVSSQKGTVKLLEQKKVGNRYQLRVEVTPPAPENELSILSDVLEVKIKGKDTLSIPFRGFY
jgi:hypothetical protein